MLTAERLLEDRSWVGKLYSDGWSDGGGASLAVLDKATGESLADVVVATPEDVARAVGIATEAQRAWAQTYAVEQRAVFIKAAPLLDEHHAEIADWIVRETGGVRPKAEFELRLSGGGGRSGRPISDTACTGTGTPTARQGPTMSRVSPHTRPDIRSGSTIQRGCRRSHDDDSCAGQSSSAMASLWRP